MKNTPTQWLQRQIKPQRKLLLAVASINYCCSLLTILQLACLAYIIYAAFILRATVSSLHLYFISFVVALSLRSLLLWAKQILAFRLGARVRMVVRASLLRHINAMGPVGVLQIGAGELSSVLIEQVEALQDYYANYLPIMLQTVLLPVTILVIVFTLSWLAGLILLICGPLIPFFMVLVGKGAASANQRNFKALARMGAHFLDVLQGLPTLKFFNRSKNQFQRIYKVSDSYRKETMRVLRIAFLSSGVLEFFSALSIALVAVFLGLSLLNYIHVGYYGHLTLFSALFILLLAPEYFLPLRELGVHYHARAQAIAAAESIVDVFSKKELASRSASRHVLNAPHEIRLNHVSFSYPGSSRKVLDGVSLLVRRGEPIYLVGESGSGKSTLLNLIMGFIEPTEGEIRIDQRDLSQLSREHWLEQIAWIGQQPRLFHATLLENLQMAKPTVTEDELWHALSQVSLHDEIMRLPQGLNTSLGEWGTGLSGGQLQRLALARVFLKDAPILLLDEPTASVDPHSAEKINHAIAEFARDRLVIIATHRTDNIPASARVML